MASEEEFIRCQVSFGQADELAVVVVVKVALLREAVGISVVGEESGVNIVVDRLSSRACTSMLGAEVDLGDQRWI